MGAFNVLDAEAGCPACGEAQRWEIQFRYGDTWQRRYRVGDRLHWGGNDVGAPGAGRVVVEGVAGPCRACRSDAFEFDIAVVNDVIVSADPVRDGERDFEEYHVIEP